jgi:hypothetical protein
MRPRTGRVAPQGAGAYRKVDVFISAVAHTWSASSTGGNSDLRANFASRLCHRMERCQARLLLHAHMATSVEQLESGQAVLHSMRHSTVVQVPKTTAADVHSIAGMLAANQPVMQHVASATPPTSASVDTSDTPERNQNETRTEAGSHPLTSDEALIAQLFYAEGLDIGQIVEQLHGSRLKGTAYQNAARPIQAAIRKVGKSSNCEK